MTQKISIERDNIKFEATIAWDANINEVMDAFKACMVGMTWSIDTIEDWIIAEAEAIQDLRDYEKSKLN